MLQFKEGMFHQIDSEKILPDLGANWDEQIAAAGFESWDSYGSADSLQLHVYRRRHSDGQQYEWLIEIWNWQGAYPDIYCESDADFMPLLLQMSSMMSACLHAQIIADVEVAISDLSEERRKVSYTFADWMKEVVSR